MLPCYFSITSKGLCTIEMRKIKSSLLSYYKPKLIIIIIILLLFCYQYYQKSGFFFQNRSKIIFCPPNRESWLRACSDIRQKRKATSLLTKKEVIFIIYYIITPHKYSWTNHTNWLANSNQKWYFPGEIVFTTFPTISSPDPQV